MVALGLCCCLRLPLVAAGRGCSSLQGRGFSLRWPLLLWSMSSRCTGFCCTQAQRRQRVARGAGGLSGSSSPLFNKPSDLTADVISLSHSLASSPASVHSFTSGGLVWAANLSSSSAGSKDTPSYQSMTSLHTSSESIDLPLSHHGSLSGLTTGTHEVQSLLMRTGSVRSTLSER